MLSKVKESEKKRIFFRILAFLLLFFLWQISSMLLGKEILLPSPFSVLKTLFLLIAEPNFWNAIWFSFLRIAKGFFLALGIGIWLAICAYHSLLIEELITPIMKIIKATPVASFIILALIWVNSRNLSILISFLMVLPVIYINVLQGLHHTDVKLLEMAKVFPMPIINKWKYIYIPEIMPYLLSACSLALGLCWKAGIAAEVIGIPTGSIGERLYEAKLYLMTGELFAWTLIIIGISVGFEKIVMYLLHYLKKYLC